LINKKAVGAGKGFVPNQDYTAYDRTLENKTLDNKAFSRAHRTQNGTKNH